MDYLKNSITNSWDPLEEPSDPGIFIAAQRREIQNILKSYTGYYDLFSEMFQNALDAVERRILDDDDQYEPRVWITIDISNGLLAVTDNGCGMDETQFKQFLRPNYSFKQGPDTRGSKGVGATYLAYGFNHLEVATRIGAKFFSGVIKQGREWVEDNTGTMNRPKVEVMDPTHAPFYKVDRGTSMVIRLTGKGIRPRELSWLGAADATIWSSVLRSTTPIGAIYICDTPQTPTTVRLEVINSGEEISHIELNKPTYLHPADVLNRTADLRDLLSDQAKRVAKHQDVSKPPPKFTKLNGLWGEWTGEEILDPQSECPIFPRLDEDEKILVKEIGIKLRIFLAYLTDLWDTYSDKTLGLRKGQRLLRGGLQLCTRHMPQGTPLTIPMTNNIGFQNLAHVLIHFENAEPDLGRKGFQPDQVRVAEKLAVSAVTAFRRHYNLLRKPGAAKAYRDELKLVVPA